MHAILGLLRKKLVLAAVAAAVVGSGAYAFAATLSVSSSSLGAGNASVASCANEAKATYTTAYDKNATQHVRIDSVKLTWDAANTACVAGDKIVISLADGTNELANIPLTLFSGDLSTGPTDSKTLTVSYTSGTAHPDGASNDGNSRTFGTLVSAPDLTDVAVAAAGQ